MSEHDSLRTMLRQIERGQAQDALAPLRRLIARGRRTTPPSWRAPMSMLGRAYVELRDYPRARAAYATALLAHQAARDVEGTILCLGGLGLCALGLGAPADAAQHLQQAIALCERSRNAPAELAWHPHLDAALAQLHRGALRIPRLTRWVALLDAAGQTSAAAEITVRLAEVALDQHELTVARDALRSATERLSQLEDDAMRQRLSNQIAVAQRVANPT